MFHDIDRSLHQVPTARQSLLSWHANVCVCVRCPLGYHVYQRLSWLSTEQWIIILFTVTIRLLMWVVTWPAAVQYVCLCEWSRDQQLCNTSAYVSDHVIGSCDGRTVDRNSRWHTILCWHALRQYSWVGIDRRFCFWEMSLASFWIQNGKFLLVLKVVFCAARIQAGRLVTS